MIAVFVYIKNDKVKVLGLDEAKTQDSILKEQGWKHTSTLDPCVFIEHVYDVFPEIKNYMSQA